jgi:hypothetical protein
VAVLGGVLMRRLAACVLSLLLVAAPMAASNILDTTTKSIRAYIEGAHTTTAPTFTSSYVLHSAVNPFVTKSSDGVLTGATPVTVVAAPAAGVDAQLKQVILHNTDSVSHTFTVELLSSATQRPMFTVALDAGETFIYEDDRGWSVLTVSGAIKTSGAGGGGGGVTDHGALTGLDDQADHPWALDRTNHTGFQAISTVTGLQSALDAALDRANHTGFQAISTVTDLQTTLEDKAGRPAQTVVVAKSGGDFASIAAAVDSILDADATKPYHVRIEAGAYTEPVIVTKPWVSIGGPSIGNVTVSPAGSHHTVQVDEGPVEINFLTFLGSAVTFACINALDVEEYLLLHKVSFVDCDPALRVRSPTVGTTVYMEYVDLSGTYATGVDVEASGTDQPAFLNAENTYTIPYTPATIVDAFRLVGPNVAVEFRSCGIWGDGGDTAFRVEDGASLIGSGSIISAFERGVLVPGGGDPPYLTLHGVSIRDNIVNLEFNHADMTGSFSGVADRAAMSFVEGVVYPMSFSDPSDVKPGTVTVGDFHVGPRIDELSEVTDLITEGSPMGLYSGGELSIVSGLTVESAAGYGYAQNDSSTQALRVEWEDSQLVLGTDDSHYVYWTSAAVLTSNATRPDVTKVVLLGRVVTDATGVVFIDAASVRGRHSSNALAEFNQRALGAVYVGGSTVTENGGTPRGLDVTAGEYHFSQNQFTPGGGAEISWIAYYHASGEWVKATETQASNSQWDDGTDLDSLPTDHYVAHSLYVVGDGADERYILVYGQTHHETQVEAEDAALPAPPPWITDGVALIASVVAQEGASQLASIIQRHPIIGARPVGTAASGLLPTPDEKAALVGTDGAPSAGNPYVTDSDPRLVGGGGGDNVTVNGAARTDVDLDNATPAAPADGVNVRWQADSAAPDNVSANLQFATASQAGAVSTAAQSFLGAKSFESQASAVVTQATGGVDEAFDSTWEAVKFTMVGTEIGDIAVQLKRTGTITAGDIRLLLFTDAAGLPGTDITETTTGMPGIVYATALDTGYTTYRFRQSKSGLTNGVPYWAVLMRSSLTGGGTVEMNRRSSGTALHAFSANGTAWTAQNTKELVHTVYNSSGTAVSGQALNFRSVWGLSDSGFGGRFESVTGPGSKSDSVHNFGVGGNSAYSYGGRFTSTANIGLRAISLSSYGMQTEGPAGGIQAVTSGAGGVSFQGVDLSGSGQILQGLNSSFAITSQLAADGSLFLGGKVDLAEIPEPAAPGADTISIYTVDQNGHSVLEAKGAGDLSRRLARDAIEVARVDEAAGVSACQVIYLSGNAGAVKLLKLARADSPTTYPGFGFTLEAGALNAFVRVLFGGLVTGCNTAGMSGPLYLSAATPGAYVDTEPLHPNIGQRVGVVARDHATQGEIMVQAVGVRGDHAGTRNATFTIGPSATNRWVLTPSTTASRTISGPDANAVVVAPDTGAANNFLTAISATGAVSKAQPSVSNLSSSTSASLRTVLSDEVGTGPAMFGLAPTMADDLSCTGSQVVRRNSGDTAFECATVAGGGGGSPGGSGSEIQYRVDGSTFGGLAQASSDGSGHIRHLEFEEFTIGPKPTTPGAGLARISAVNVAGRAMPAFVGPTGLDWTFQAGLSENNIWMFLPNTGTTVTEWGIDITSAGTFATPTLASTNLQTQMRRLRIPTITTAGSSASARSSATMHWRGNAARLGGWTMSCRVGLSTALAQQRAFVGLLGSTAAIGNVNPSTLTNVVGFGYDSAQTRWRLIHNDSSGTATTVDLGTSFPTNSTSEVYDLTTFAAPNSSTIGWRIVRLSDDLTSSGTISTDMPANTVFLGVHVWTNNGTTAAAAQIDVARCYGSSDI